MERETVLASRLAALPWTFISYAAEVSDFKVLDRPFSLFECPMQEDFTS